MSKVEEFKQRVAAVTGSTEGREMPQIHDSVLVIATREDRNTILAALRLYQQQGMGEPANRSDIIHDISTHDGDDISYAATDIDDLCERVNFAPMQPPRLTHADINEVVYEIGLRPTFEQSSKLCKLLDQKPLSHREEDFPGVEIGRAVTDQVNVPDPKAVAMPQALRVGHVQGAASAIVHKLFGTIADKQAEIATVREGITNWLTGLRQREVLGLDRHAQKDDGTDEVRDASPRMRM